jgi:hypothetical protein
MKSILQKNKFCLNTAEPCCDEVEGTYYGTILVQISSVLVIRANLTNNYNEWTIFVLQGYRFMVFNATSNNISVITYIVVVSFIGEGNWSTRKKPPTCRKSLTNFIT